MTSKRIPAQTLHMRPWEEMVSILSWSKDDTIGSQVMSASSGIVSALSDLLVAASIEDVAQHCGRAEFHVEAMYQYLGGRQAGIADGLEVSRSDAARNQVLSTVGTALCFAAGNLFTACQMIWKKPEALTVSVEIDMRMEILRIEAMLGCVRRLIGLRREDLLEAYRIELAKQFPKQCYSTHKPGASNTEIH